MAAGAVILTETTAAELFQSSVEHFQSGKIVEAEHCCRQALALDAQHADALHLMGVLCFQAQQYDAAAEWIECAIKQGPKASYFSSLGRVRQRQNRLEQARQAYEQALTLNPQDAVVLNLGDVLMRLGHKEEAVRHLQQALKLNPQHEGAANMCGMLLLDLSRNAEALECFDISEKLNPNNATLYQTRGLCLQRMHRFEEAQSDFEKSVALDPKLAEAHKNLGSLHLRFGRMEQALACFDRALEARPDFFAALNEKARVSWHLQSLDEAFAFFDKSLAIDPDNPSTITNLALLQLLTGDFERGWLGREARWKLPPGHFVHRGFSQPLWLGDQPIAGKTILLHADEGLGDSIQYARYVPMVAALGAQVILEVQPAIQQLLAGLSGVARCVGIPSASSLAFDLHCPLGSLPLAFGTRLETIPSATRYLPAPTATRVKAWEDRLGPRNRFRVGLVWSGNPAHDNDHNRSMALRILAPLLDCDAQFISLQKGVRDSDKAFLGERSDIVDLTDQLTDFSDTAALISCLDLVISIDTSVVHLAGALGAPVWTLLPFNPDFRWLLNRDDNPWYPSMRLFRQPKRGDWANVVQRVRRELESLVAAWRPGQVSWFEPAEPTPAELCQVGLEHFQSGKIAEAEHCYRQALALDGQHADALHLMGVLCLQAQQYDAAAEWIVRAIKQAPKAAYFSSLGTLLQRQDRLEQARQAYEKALNLNPQNAVFWKNLGAVLWQLGCTEEAVRHFQQAFKLNPQYFEAANSCGSLLFDLGRYAEALECFNICEKLNPDAALYQMRGVCFQQVGRLEEAQADYEKSIALDPGQAETHKNLGSLHSRLGRMEQAFTCFDRALELRPDFPAALSEKAVALWDMQLLDEAFALFHKSLAIEPDNAHTITNLGMLQLQTGDYERGWLGREARWKLPPGHYVHRGFSQPLWLGDQSIAGKTILLHADEGMGDSIFYARYVPMVAGLGAQVILEVAPPLQRLMAGVPGVARCVGLPSATSLAFDLRCPLASLPLAFGTRLDTIPSAVPYLPVPTAERVKAWEDRLGPRNRFRVGLVWSGNPAQDNDHNRSMALRTLAPLLDCDVQFVSLQKGVRDSDKAFLAERSDIVDLTEHLTDFSETAALVSCLDLVISVCTSVAHLAGALGAPAWTMLSFDPDFRWLLNRDDSPWYPSMRLFRQTAPREWSGVIEQVRTELRKVIAGWSPAKG